MSEKTVMYFNIGIGTIVAIMTTSLYFIINNA